MTRKELEEMLYNYNNLIRLIDDLEDQRDYVSTYGATEKHLGVLETSKGTNTLVNDYERLENEIKALEYRIRFYQRKKRMIDTLLECIKCEEHYKMIEYRFFKGMTTTQIADIYYIDKSNVSRRIKKLLNQMLDVYIKFYSCEEGFYMHCSK